MSGETERNVSSWTVDSLKEYLEAVLNGNDKRYEQRFQAQEAANKYAQEKANEFRGSLDDVGKKQMPRAEAEAEFKAIRDQSAGRLQTLNEMIAGLQARLDRMDGRSGGLNSSWAYLVGAVGLLAALIAIFLKLK